MVLITWANNSLWNMSFIQSQKIVIVGSKFLVFTILYYIKPTNLAIGTVSKLIHLVKPKPSKPRSHDIAWAIMQVKPRPNGNAKVLYVVIYHFSVGVQRCRSVFNLHIARAISWESSLPMTLIPSQFKESMRFDSLY